MKDSTPRFDYISTADLPTQHGKFKIHGFVEVESNQEHVALSYGDWSEDDTVLIRVHSELFNW